MKPEDFLKIVKVNNINRVPIEEIPLLTTWYHDDKAWVYNESDDLKKRRVAASLDAMTDFILDENIREGAVRETHPLFLSYHTWIDKKSWGRKQFMAELGGFRHQAAYDNLREVYLHDSNEEISDRALHAVSQLGREDILDDVHRRMKVVTPDNDSMHAYIDAVGQFKSDRAVDLLMDIAEIAKELYSADDYVLNKEGKLVESGIRKASLDKGATTQFFIGILQAFSFMKGEKVKDASATIASWYPDELYLQNLNKHVQKESYVSRPGPLIIMPEEKPKELYGSQVADVPF